MKMLSPGMLLAILGMASCTAPQPASQSTGMKNPANEAIVKKYVDAIVHGNLATMDSLMADNYMSRGPAWKDSSNKADNLAGWKKGWDSLYTSINFDRIEMLSTHIDSGRAAGDWVLDWAIVKLNYKTGKSPVTFNLHVAYRLKDGKIAGEHDYFDVNDIMKQRGYTMTPPAAAGAK